MLVLVWEWGFESLPGHQSVLVIANSVQSPERVRYSGGSITLIPVVGETPAKQEFGDGSADGKRARSP